MTTRTVSLRHHGNRVVGPVETTDAAYCRDMGTGGRAPRNVRDAVLEAVGPGNIMRLGQAFEGGERARLDLAAVEIARLTTPISDPTGARKLAAESAPAVLDLGLVLDGLELIRRALEADSPEARDALRWRGLNMLEHAVRTAKAADGNCFTRSRASQDAAYAAIAAGEAAIAHHRLGGAPTADASNASPPKGPVTVDDDINEINRRFWAQQAQR